MKLFTRSAIYFSLLLSFSAQAYAASPRLVDVLDQITKLNCYLTGISSLSTVKSKPLTLELITNKTDYDATTNVRLDVAMYDTKSREYKLHLTGLNENKVAFSGYLVLKQSNQSSFLTVEQFFADPGSSDLQHSPSAFCVLN